MYNSQVIPYRIRRLLENSSNLLHYLVKRKKRPCSDKSTLISFCCGFHGNTGGAIAMASIANVLTKHYTVEFVTYPTSNFNRRLDESVQLVPRANSNSKLFICDVSCERSHLEWVSELGIPLIISCHGFLDRAHGSNSERILETLSFADQVHFVSEWQRQSFPLDADASWVIPNTCTMVEKDRSTNNVGCVGNLDLPSKNADAAVRIGLESNADLVQLWGGETNRWHNNRVRFNGWCDNRNRIYDSFDVLTFLSEFETFGLVVIEALSAGIPCLLSDIPTFRRFSDCPGVLIADSDVKKAASQVNELLENKEILTPQIKHYFRERYGESKISAEWCRFADQLISGAKDIEFDCHPIAH